jgi:hypothetical protein
MARLTPGLGIKGAFLLKEPFTTQADLEYSVTALRSFAEIRARREDPVELIYTPVGLTESDMNNDIAQGAQIVVLSTNAGVLTYVPDTYVLSYPSMGSIPYSHLIASASLGMLPDDYDTAAIEQTMASALSDHIGVEPEVFITRGAVSDQVTEDMHVQLTISREAAITNRETDRAAVIRLEALVASQQDTITQYETIIEQLTAANQP